MRFSTISALAASVSSVAAVSQGFNYGATNSDGSFKFQKDYEAEFRAAKNLPGTSGFTSARLYTTVQGGSSTDEATSAIPAAIATDTTLLLGIWASGGANGIASELKALKAAIAQYGSAFTDRVVSISVGSEDLYRASDLGVKANAGIGADSKTIASYISQVKDAIKDTPLASKGVGHVDTWTAWVDGANKAVVEASDWIGFDAYPYFQNTMSNSIDSGKALFEKALADTQGVVGSKEIWITETGWPVSGKTENLGVPGVENAKRYWDEVGCPRFGKVNVWWYTLQDAAPTTPNPSFGILGSSLNSQPLHDLSCKTSTSTSSSASATGTASASKSASSASSLSSALSSFTTAVAGGGIASSGSPLSPTQAVVPSQNNATTTGGVIPVSSGSAGNLTKPTGPATVPTTGPSVSANGGSMISGSVVAVAAAMIAFFAL